jgi:nitrite reductase/ring-hydroxylating ferredoxin subunit/DMSO/TMAO reductase YedYZ heme-binding membrane subunit
MSVKYIPVQWNKNKYLYDGVLLVCVLVFLCIYLYVAPALLDHERPINPAIHNARAFGACAFVMMTFILIIGPLARLDRRFLPLLYNRRHFGVLTALVALTHALTIMNWYFIGGPVSRYEAVLNSNLAYDRLIGFPFESFGIFALLCLGVLAATSHDFWLKFLTPPIWKALHYLIYPAYAAVVAHVLLGSAQTGHDGVFPTLVIGGAVTVASLHVIAALWERTRGDPRSDLSQDWERVCRFSEIEEGRAKIALLSSGERVAVFCHEGALSAISNACAHQNGPLGEGRIINCLVTCPWHGFQYDVRTGRSPAPFTETVPTYDLRIEGADVLVRTAPNPPGTPVDPVPVPPSDTREVS